MPSTTSASLAWNDFRAALADRDGAPRSTLALDLERFDAHAERLALGRADRFAVGAEAARRDLFGRGLLPAFWDEWDEEGDEAKFAEWERWNREMDDDWTDEPIGGVGDPRVVHTRHPFNCEPPPHLLDDAVTPIEHHFVRNNGTWPERAKTFALADWSLTIDGEVAREVELSMGDLVALPQVTERVVLECAGNGRSYFSPGVGGTPWRRGAVACAEWSGPRLRDVLERAGVLDSAVYLAFYGEDGPAEPGGEAFSRGIPIEKALDEHTLLALRINGEPLPGAHGFPARVIVPGWIGSAMQKWLRRIWVRDRVHDSEKMTDYAYRMPTRPVAPGERPSTDEMEIATSLVVNSLVTRPETGVEVDAGESVEVGGHAWAGERGIAKVEVSVDFGATWHEAALEEPAGRWAWWNWHHVATFDRAGYAEIWARATDDAGDVQPFLQPWNPEGYLGNVVHRLPVFVVRV